MGWAWGASPVGIYRKAYELMMLPVRQLNVPVSSVMLPALSRLQNDPHGFTNTYLQALQVLAIAGMPLIAFLFAEADVIIWLLLGPEWAEAATLFRILAPAACFAVIYSAPHYLVMTLGQGGRKLKMSIIELGITILCLSIATPFGVVWMAVAVSIGSVTSLLLTTTFATRKSPVAFRQILNALTPTIVASIIMAATLYSLVRFRGSEPIWLLPDLALGLLVFALTLLCSRQGRLTLQLFVTLIKKRLTR